MQGALQGSGQGACWDPPAETDPAASMQEAAPWTGPSRVESRPKKPGSHIPPRPAQPGHTRATVHTVASVLGSAPSSADRWTGTRKANVTKKKTTMVSTVTTASQHQGRHGSKAKEGGGQPTCGGHSWLLVATLPRRPKGPAPALKYFGYVFITWPGTKRLSNDTLNKMELKNG